MTSKTQKTPNNLIESEDVELKLAKKTYNIQKTQKTPIESEDSEQ